jgi:hypothetical protein
VFSALVIISSFYPVQVSISSLILIQQLSDFCYDSSSAPSPAQVSSPSAPYYAIYSVFSALFYHQLFLSCGLMQVSISSLVLIQQFPDFCYDSVSAPSHAQVSFSSLLSHLLHVSVLFIISSFYPVQVSISSRLLPSQEVQAVKTNIGLVVLTNISIFLFLIQVSITKKAYRNCRVKILYISF